MPTNTANHNSSDLSQAPWFPLNPAWVDTFVDVFTLCRVQADESVILLSELTSRQDNLGLCKLALNKMDLPYSEIVLPTGKIASGPIIKSTGASTALNGAHDAVNTLSQSDFIIDLTVEGLMHAEQTGKILAGGARILNISAENPEVLVRLAPKASDKAPVRDAAKRCKGASSMTVTSDAGTHLSVDMRSAATVGVWGWTDRPGTLAHWPGGLVVSFPQAETVNGTIVMAPGDMNLTFKRYIESPIELTIEKDFITRIEGSGVDAALMKNYLASFNEPDAYATSHVGWGLNPAARYEALTMYDKSDINGTELRALAGNFLYSTGANEFANRFARGHFDLPILNCTIELDGVAVVENGVVV